MSVSCIQLSKSYKGVQALERISFNCADGQILGILGANGAGKTTLFKILLGLVTPDSGSVTYSSTKAKKAGAIIEKPALYEFLSASNNLWTFAKIQGVALTQQALEKRLEQVGLNPGRRDRVGNYSLGMKQRLGIAIALLNNPQCLILDEPFSGLDPLGIEALRNLILSLAKNEGLTILLSSHIVEEISKVCENIIVLSHGKMIAQGSTTAILGAVQTSYLLVGPDLGSSETLKKHEVSFNENTALVQIHKNSIGDVLKALAGENIEIDSCIPQLDMAKLFDGK